MKLIICVLMAGLLSGCKDYEIRYAKEDSESFIECDPYGMKQRRISIFRYANQTNDSREIRVSKWSPILPMKKEKP